MLRYLARPRLLLAVLQYAAERESTGPWRERKGRVIPVELPPQVDRGLLEDLMRVVDVGHKPQDIPEDLALPLYEQSNEPFGILSRHGGWHNV